MGKPEVLNFFFIFLGGNVYKHIATVLCLVTITVAWVARTSAEDGIDFIIVMIVRTYIDEGTFLIWHFGSMVHRQIIVIVTIGATKDGIDSTHMIFHIGSGFQDIGYFIGLVAMNHALVLIPLPNTFSELIAVLELAMNRSAEVVTAIDDITHKRETMRVDIDIISIDTCRLGAYINLCVTQNIGITGSAKGIINTAVEQVNIRVTTDIALITATIEVLALG